jgi:hypothetical protein
MSDLPADAIVIEDNSKGVLWNNNGNETIMDSKFSDASKFRVGSPYEKGQSGGGGAFSFDIIGGMPPRQDGSAPPTRVEVALFTGAVTSEGGGEVGLSITRPGTWSDIDDAAQQKVVEFRGDQVEFKVPISAPNLGAAVPVNVVRMWAPNGLSFTQQQDDTNFVTYVTSVAFSIDPSHVKAVWSRMTGPLT